MELNSLVQQNSNNILENKTLHRNIVQSILMGVCTIPEDIVDKFGITYNEAIELFSNPNFISTITKYSQAKMKMSFYGRDLIRLDKIIESEDDKTAIQGIKLKAQLTNTLKGTTPDVNVGIQFNLESLIRQDQKEKQVVNPIDIDFERK